MAVSVLDTLVGAYSTAWSAPGWTVQQDVSGAVVTATGGTYETRALVREADSEPQDRSEGREESSD
jgi:hypothetical protein